MDHATFGTLLKLFRERGASGQGARWSLTQARFGERVEDELGLAPGTYRAQVVSKWELDQKIIPASERALLIAIVKILVEERRIGVPPEGDRLLNAGGYQSLTPDEIALLFTSAAAPAESVPEPDLAAPTVDREAPTAPIDETRATIADVGRTPFRVSPRRWGGLGLLVLGVVLIVIGLGALGLGAVAGRAGLAIGAFVAGAIALLAAAWALWPSADITGPRSTATAHGSVQLVADTCGDRPWPLGHQRLLLTAAFGAYFADLLEREPLYVDLAGQIDAALDGATPALAPVQRLIWALTNPRGPRVLILAGEGGLGKSTLAAKLVRCLFERNAVDLILGDSAKTRVVDPVTGAVGRLDPAFYTAEQFSARLAEQLGLPPTPPGKRSRIEQARDRLAGRRAVIVVDNLETVSAAHDLLRDLRQLVSRDVRVIATTRSVAGLERMSGVGVVHLHGLPSVAEVRTFIRWHIRAHAAGHPALARVEADLAQMPRLKRLLQRTGGSPLLIQLLISDIARQGWSVLDQLPTLYGRALLGFLYDDRWQDLNQAGDAGRCACRILGFVAAEQEAGKPVTLERLSVWTASQDLAEHQAEALRLLQERFLLMLREAERGHLSLFPSLAQFVRVRSDES
ncbi:MAG: ATP-binding protein [Anaerolineales bacterium]|nr:ATP-binding protein [Anaerolineales bacterium]